MADNIWHKFEKNKGSINYLKKLNDEFKFIQLQINLINLKLCIKRNNLGIPIELWNIICGCIEGHINNFAPKSEFTYICPVIKQQVNLLGSFLPKNCICHDTIINHDFSSRYMEIGSQYGLSRDVKKLIR